MLRLTLPWIWNHPLGCRNRPAAYGRYLFWQLRHRFNSKSFVLPWVNNTRLALEPRMAGATGNYYCGLHEWPDMAFVLHLLRPEDSFADIGANVGSYTVLASGAVGCHTEAFEPVPATYQRLLAHIELNEISHLVHPHQAAVGATQGSLFFSIDRDSMNQVVAADYPGLSKELPVLAVDQLPALRHSVCWKLDVEGHEQALLAGAQETLADAPPAAILCEDRSEPVAKCLLEAGFQIYNYNPWTRRLLLDPSGSASCSNQLWIRNQEFVQTRLLAAPSFSVFGENI